MTLYLIVAFVLGAQGPHMEISKSYYPTVEACDKDAKEVSEGYQMEGHRAFVQCVEAPGSKT